MSDSRVDDLLDAWEDRVIPRPAAKDFLAAVAPDLAPELVEQFLQRAGKLMQMDELFRRANTTTPTTLPFEPVAAVSSEQSPAATGSRFVVRHIHAHGGLGVVFVAEDTELHREVAIKEIQERNAHDPNIRARFLREAEITGKLEHPGIVPVYGLGSSPDSRPYYAMRLIKGESLNAAIRRLYEKGGIGKVGEVGGGLRFGHDYAA